MTAPRRRRPILRGRVFKFLRRTYGIDLVSAISSARRFRYRVGDPPYVDNLRQCLAALARAARADSRRRDS